ncbi:metallophosphoesterase [Edaphosphingomonas haloaromaticamans]|nr:metallophosphoesterase [Sphingomonas haloaromaticamans]
MADAATFGTDRESRSKARFSRTIAATVALLGSVLPASHAEASDQPAPVAAALQPLAEWTFELDNALPRRADPAPKRETPPLPLISTELARPTLSGMRATERRMLDAEQHGEAFTVELWLLDHVNQRIGALIDSGQPRPDWALGYISGEALFGPVRADGMPLLKAETGEGYKRRWHHVVGVRDGARWTLYVDGVVKGQAELPANAVSDASLQLSGFFEAERFMRLDDLVRAAAIYGRALSAAEVKDAFDRRTRLVEEGWLTDKGLHFTQPPYLNTPTTTSIELSWETNRPVATTVEWGETADALQSRQIPRDGKRIGGLRLDGLKVDTPYFYRVTGVDTQGNEVRSGLLSFRTAPPPGVPFTMAISADTEARTHINRRMSALIWEERPNVLLLAGDLTDGGSLERRFEWTHEYFAGMGPLFGRVPVIAAPGNGESELHWFRHYHRQPGDEAFFNIRYGDAEIFVIDSNLEDREKREPGFRARQRAWLDQALASSTAKWKIAMHHHALRSTDEDDYGDSWTGVSHGGDPVVTAELEPIYEKHSVNLVIVGHLHTYERSWPIRGGKIDMANGITYVQVGGMGGNLEDFQPTKPGFNRKTFRDHHYLMLRGAGDRLEAEAIDADGHLRDAFTITK